MIRARADGFSAALPPGKWIVSNKKLALAVSASRAARREAYARTTHRLGEGNRPGSRLLWPSEPRGRCPSEDLTPLWHLLSLGRADKGVLQGAAQQDRQRRSRENAGEMKTLETDPPLRVWQGTVVCADRLFVVTLPPGFSCSLLTSASSLICTSSSHQPCLPPLLFNRKKVVLLSSTTTALSSYSQPKQDCKLDRIQGRAICYSVLPQLHLHRDPSVAVS